MAKKKDSFDKFIRWVIGNTAWDYFKRFASALSSVGATSWASLRSNILGWVENMDMSLIIAIIAMLVGFFAIFWSLLSLLYWLYKVSLADNEKGINPICKIRKDGREVYIDIKNREWVADIARIIVRCNFLYNGKPVFSSLEWLQNSNKKGETFIGRRKTKTIHFATINHLQKTYVLHFLDNDLVFPFLNDRAIELGVEGYTTPKKKNLYDKDINNTLLILESVSKGVLNFEIGRYL